VQSNNIILNGLRLLISRQTRRAFARNADILLVFSLSVLYTLAGKCILKAPYGVFYCIIIICLPAKCKQGKDSQGSILYNDHTVKSYDIYNMACLILFRYRYICYTYIFYTLSFEFLYFSIQVYTFITLQYIDVCDAVCF
jgi:hypothetical protein